MSVEKGYQLGDKIIRLSQSSHWGVIKVWIKL